jgi:hypothetical protein
MTAQRNLEHLERIGRGMVGLLASAGFGALVGLRAGALAGGAVGTVVPVIGNIIGLFVGAVVGALVGVPAGILCDTLQGRNGCRAGGATGALLVPLVYVLRNGGWSVVVRDDTWIGAAVLAAFAAVGIIAGEWVWRKRAVDAPGMFQQWNRQSERWGLDRLTLAERLFSTLLLSLPALVFLLTRR